MMHLEALGRCSAPSPRRVDLLDRGRAQWFNL